MTTKDGTVNTFLEHSCAKCGVENNSGPFSKKSKSLDQQSSMSYTVNISYWNFIQFAFIVCPSWGLPKHIGTKVLLTHF